MNLQKKTSWLASLLQNYDIVVIQELVAPPFDGNYPDETEFESDTEALEFFNAMENVVGSFKYHSFTNRGF